MITPKIIDNIKQRLINTFDPVEIYVFGSYAWGNPDDDSDIDILIVVDQLKQKQWEAESLGYEVLFDFDVPKDIVVFPKQEFEQRSKEISSLFYTIKQRGIKLYARA